MSLNWVQSNAYAGVPHDGVIAGHDIDGAAIYVGRAYHNGDHIPAKVIPSKQVAYIAYNGSEVAKSEFQVLCGHGFQWVQSGSGHVPDSAVTSGSTSSGEPLYVGRTHINGSLTTGKIHPSHNCIYVPFNGTEHSSSQYEVLIAPRQRSHWVPSTVHSSLPEGAVLAGHDSDNSPIYVGRAWHAGDHLPAKVIPSKNACYVAYGGQEIGKDSYEILCHGNLQWVRSHPGSRSVPPNSVPGGRTTNGETLYVGRAHHSGSLTVGKLQLSHGALYIPFAGNEVSIGSDIDVLVEQ